MDSPAVLDAMHRNARPREALSRLAGNLLFLDQPEGFTGHFGGSTALFASRYGQCLWHFATAAQPATAC